MAISELTCNEGFETYTLVLDFDYANTDQDGFDVFGPGGIFVGYFLYVNLPITITNFPAITNATSYIKVQNNDNADCFGILEFIVPNCEGACALTNLVVEAGECTDGHYYGILDFDHTNTVADSFRLRIDNVFIGTFAYSALPLTVGPYAGNGTTVHHFLVRDKGLETCFDEYEMAPVNCEPVGDCSIYDMTYEVTPCIEGHYFVVLDFEYSNPAADHFKVQGNGQQYGSFSYTALPIVLGPFAGDGTTVHEFVAKDLGNLECQDHVVVPAVNCTVGTADLLQTAVKLNGIGNIVALEGTVPVRSQWFDILGQTVQPRHINATTWQFDTQPTGAYILVVHDAQGRRFVQQWLLTK